MRMFASKLYAQNDPDRAFDALTSEVSYYQEYLQAGKPYPVSMDLYHQFFMVTTEVTRGFESLEADDPRRAEFENLYRQAQLVAEQVFGQQLSPLNTSSAQTDTASQNRDEVDINNGQLNGFILDHLGNPVSDALVKLYNRNGVYQESYYSRDNGHYSFSYLYSQDYYLTVQAIGHEDQGSFGVPCHQGIGWGCEIADLQSIFLETNESLYGLNFHLNIIPTISGSVSLLGVNTTYIAELYDSMGELASSHFLSEEAFTIEVPEPGDYRLLINPYFYELGMRMYADVACFGLCDLSQADVITATDQHLTLDPIVLVENRFIRGNLSDFHTGEPVSNIDYIELFDVQTGTLMLRFPGELVQANGDFSFWADPGDYHLRVRSAQYAVHYAYDQNCQSADLKSCDLNQLSPTVITHNDQTDTENIDLTLLKAGSISGHILPNTRDITVPFFTVVLYDQNGEILDTDRIENGQYSFQGLADGTYYVATSEDFQPTAYPNHICEITRTDFRVCLDVVNSTPIVIDQFAQLENIDIIQSARPTISGTVRNQNGDPMNNVGIKIYEWFDGELRAVGGYGSNSQDGTFTRTLYPGTFYLEAKNTSGLYDFDKPNHYSWHLDAHCPLDDLACALASAEPIVVDDYIDFPDKDITMINKGIVQLDIHGTQSSSASGLVHVYDETGALLHSLYIQTSGERQIYLPEGNYYFAYSYDESGYNSQAAYISQVYGFGDCFTNCDPLSGTPVSITDGETTVVTMPVNKSPIINVRANDFVQGTELVIYVNDTEFVTRTLPRWIESYSLNTDQPFKAGLLLDGYYPAFYDNVQCTDLTCALAGATLIDIDPWQSVTFETTLQAKTRVSGKVTGSDGFLPNVQVQLVPVNPGAETQSTYSESGTGQYVFAGVPDGDYYLYAGSNSYAWTMAGAGTCAPVEACDLNSAQVIEVRNDQYLENVDIELLRLGSVLVDRIHYTSGQVVRKADLWLYEFRDGQYHYVKEDSMILGLIISVSDLLPQNYKLMAVQQVNGHFSKTVYPGVSCHGISEQTCLSMGADVNIPLDQQTVVDDFIIPSPTALEVHVTDAVSGAYIDEYYVKLYNPENGFSLLNQFVSGSVSSEVIPVSPHHEYTLEITLPDGSAYYPILYDGIECNQGVGVDCEASDGTIIQVGDQNQETINIELNRRPKLNVTVQDATTGQNFPARIKIYRDNGTVLSIIQSPAGQFSLIMAPGSYHVLAEADDYETMAYPDSRCSQFYLSTCAGGYQLAEVDGNDETNIVMNMKLTYGVQGFVTEVKNGTPLPGVTIDLWDQHGQHLDSALTLANGGFSIPTNSSLLYISTDVPRPSDLFDLIYPNTLCFEGSAFDGYCDVTEGELFNPYRPPVLNLGLKTDLIHVDGFDSDSTTAASINLE